MRMERRVHTLGTYAVINNVGIFKCALRCVGSASTFRARRFQEALSHARAVMLDNESESRTSIKGKMPFEV